MRISFHGQVVDEPEIRAGFIGCGSHSFRNIYPTFQFAPVNLVSVCDLNLEKARAFAAKFGAASAYADYKEMLQKEKLGAVFVVTNYDERGFPRYPDIAVDCLNAGVHVWIEKPPAARCSDIERMQEASKAAGKHVLAGIKKMFFPANEKAKELMSSPDFGRPNLVLLQYPQAVPETDDLRRYIAGEKKSAHCIAFLDHLCHPMSLLVYLMGMPSTLFYERTFSGAGMATFTFASGAVASLALTQGASVYDGLERTQIISDKGRHIVVDNNTRVSYHKTPSSPPGQTYGSTPDCFVGSAPGETTSVWTPEFSLGQLYNKGLFLLGYYGEVNEFARSILENRPPAKGTLEQAWQVTRVFEAFAEGPGKTISLAGKP